MGLTLGMNLKFYISVAKVLKLKVEKFLGLIPIFVGVTGEKLVVVVGGGAFCPSPPSWIGLKTPGIWLAWGFFQSSSVKSTEVSGAFFVILHIANVYIKPSSEKANPRS